MNNAVNTTKAAAVYFLAAYFAYGKGHPLYLTPLTGSTGHMGHLERDKARRFTTLTDAARALLKHLGELDWPFQIIRVEETPGVEQRIVLGETEAAPTGVVVKYAAAFFGGNWLCRGVNPLEETRRLANADLFDTQGLALTAVQQHTAKNNSWLYVETIHRIALIPGEPTITETVLS